MCNKAKGRGTRLVSETAYAQTGEQTEDAREETGGCGGRGQ